MEDITDADYMHAKTVYKDFQKKKLGENHELYIQNDATLLADVFAIFKNICLEIYDVDPVKVLSVK